MNTDIRVETSFLNHHKRHRLTRMLGIGATHYLVNLWISVSLQAPDGVLRGWDQQDIADAAQWHEDPKTLVDALVKCGSPKLGFLELNDGVYCLHDWADHQPWAIHAQARRDRARRAAETRWKRRAEEEDSKMQQASDEHCAAHAQSNARGNAPILSSPTLTSPNQVPPYSPPKGGTDSRFEIFWEAYPKKRSRGRAEKAFKKARVDELLLQAILTALERAKTSPEWLKDGGQYIPYPEKWLNAKGWLDEHGAPIRAGPAARTLPSSQDLKRDLETFRTSRKGG